MRVSLAIDYDGDLADSLRAVANLIEEYGPAFMNDPTSFYGIYNDASVHRVDITDPVDNADDEPDDNCYEQCPMCGHRELSDGYGNNDCPNDCGETMIVCAPGCHLA